MPAQPFHLPSRPRLLAAVGAVVLMAATTIAMLPTRPASSVPVAAGDVAYARCGRVFPDPHAYWPSPVAPAGQSPWAKGNAVCRAVDFLGWDETIAGLRYLESKLPRFLEVADLSDPAGPFAADLGLAGADGLSAGLPVESFQRERVPMYLVRVTDEAAAQPIAQREHFAYSLSIHGIERAGLEGGVRAIEDLATWAACEADATALPTCPLNGPYPHPVMETMPKESVGAGDALRRSSLWFVLANPDGWRRGDKQSGGYFYQRYNGNGMDLNRDWPTLGYTYRPFTPSSEPETRAIGTALRRVKDTWNAGLDLHGQLIDRAFSFTLLRGGQRTFGNDRRILQFTKGAFADAETRLAWSPAIKPNDAPPACIPPGTSGEVNQPPGCDTTERVYGVQWGTTWDTIGYSTTGSIGDWMDSPIGLGADGIDNEMSLSHLSNCGTGTCYLPDFEQLHVDGNKSLIFAMLHYSLLPEDTAFRYAGKAAWLDHDGRLTNAGSGASAGTGGSAQGLPPQPGFAADIVVGPFSEATHTFVVKGVDEGVFNGAISLTATSANVGGVSPGSFLDIAIDKFQDGAWEAQNSYYNQGDPYLQAGARVDVNSPVPGLYRVRLEGPVAGVVHVDVKFLHELAWPDPGQASYDVSNLDFFDDLRPFAPAGALEPAPIDAVIDGTVNLGALDTLVITDGAYLPGFDPLAAAGGVAQTPIHATTSVGPPTFFFTSDFTSAYYEFDVQQGQASLEATVTAPTADDPDLSLYRQLGDGSWSGPVAESRTSRPNRETLTYGSPRPGHYRLEISSLGAGTPGDATLDIAFTAAGAVSGGPGASGYDAEDERALLARLRSFVEGGGNLVLTDDGLRVVERMGLVPAGAVGRDTVYAGFIEYSTDGGATSTYSDALAHGVQQAGAAEGPAHRHQMSEPVPLGYAIYDDNGFDSDSMPEWSIDRRAWEAAGGRVVGMANGGVTLGELPVGAGRVRVLGSLLPAPSEAFDHPFGLASYAVTYSGYETFRNLLDVGSSRVSSGAGAGGGAGGGSGSLPATGGAALGWWPLVMAMLGVGVLWLGRCVRRSDG